MGALTVTIDSRGIVGNLRYARGTIDFSNSYATGGDTGLTAVRLGMDSVFMMNIGHRAGYDLEYVYASGNVIATRVGALTITSHGTHPHNITTVAAAGGGTAMLTPMVAGPLEGGAQVNTSAVDVSAALTHTASSQVALAQVTAAVDLSATLTAVRFLAFGV